MEGTDNLPSKHTLKIMGDLNATVMVIQKELENLNKSFTEMKLENDLAHKDILLQMVCMAKENKDNFVSKDEFSPVRSVVYGMVGFVMLSFLTAIVALVLK
jgi:hypothetical protein